MKKEYLNIQIGNSVKQVECLHDSGNRIYKLEEDIVVDEWRIKGFIKYIAHNPFWKFDVYANYEYVIADKMGKERVEIYYYHNVGCNKNKCGLGPSDDFSAQGVLSYFIKNSPIFKCADWEEYDLSIELNKIKKVLENGRSKQEQLREIRRIINKRN